MITAEECAAPVSLRRILIRNPTPPRGRPPGRCFSLGNREFSEKLGCSKSQQLVTDSRHERSHVALKTGRRATGKAYQCPNNPYRRGGCNRELRRILIPRTWVNKAKKKAGA
jgi:hypothetical protein